MGQVTEKIRWYRCRNPYCRREWSRSTILSFGTDLDGSYHRDGSHCPKCHKPAQPFEVKIVSYIPREEQERREQTKNAFRSLFFGW